MELRGHLRPRLVEAFNECQYRAFLNGDHFTFNEDDVFLGGISWLYDYKAAGITRAAAIAETEAIENQLWLAEASPDGQIIGALVEQPLMRTAYKDFHHVIFGHVVYQHRAFITQLPPGNYVSILLTRFPGEPAFMDTVYLDIGPTSG